MHCDFRDLARLLALSLAIGSSYAFYIPGYSIRSYEDDEPIPLYVNKVYSDRTQLQYPYYDLPFVCPPSGAPRAGGRASGRGVPLNLGEVLRGDRIATSDYELAMGRDVECAALCSASVDRAGLRRARRLVERGYVAEWIVDNLPGATSFVTVDRSAKYYAAGFKLGDRAVDPATGQPVFHLHNHLTLVLRWRAAPGRAGARGAKVVVGFEVYTKSVGPAGRNSTGCPRELRRADGPAMALHLAPNNTLAAQRYPGSSYLPEEDEADDGARLEIPYSYSVYWREDERVEWANRWDLYFRHREESARVHWLAIANALVVAGLLSAVVAVVWSRAVHGDAKGSPASEESGLRARVGGKRSGGRLAAGARSPRAPEKAGLLDGIDGANVGTDDGLSSDDDAASSVGPDDASGWKLLHADAFRAPAHAGLLAPLVGSGAQLAFMALGLLVLSCLGVLNPSFRGGFVSVGAGLFVFAGVLAGYYSGRLYKTFGGVNWRKNTLMTALLVPGLIFATIFVLNLFVWAQASSTALPFGTLLGLAALWLLIQVPLVYAGGWVAHHRVRPWDHPTRTSAIPRQIPEGPAWTARRAGVVLAAGLVPFAVVFIELLFVFRSLWQDKSGYYYVYGFLSVVSLVEIVTVVEVTIVATYLQLCAENYHWWWQSFLVGGSSAAWIFLYCGWYYFAKLHVEGFVSAFLFFSYSLLACAVYGLLTGTVGFLTAYAFVRRIYGAIKAD